MELEGRNTGSNLKASRMMNMILGLGAPSVTPNVRLPPIKSGKILGALPNLRLALRFWPQQPFIWPRRLLGHLTVLSLAEYTAWFSALLNFTG